MEYMLCLCLCVVVWVRCGAAIDVASTVTVDNAIGKFVDSLDVVSLELIENMDNDTTINQRRTRDVETTGALSPHVWHDFQKDTKAIDRQYLAVTDASSSSVQLLGYDNSPARHWSFVPEANLLIADNLQGLRIYNVTQEHEKHWTFVDRALPDTLFIRGFVSEDRDDNVVYFITTRRLGRDVFVKLRLLHTNSLRIVENVRSVNILSGSLVSLELPNKLQDIVLLQEGMPHLRLTVLQYVASHAGAQAQLLIKTVRDFPSDVTQVSVFLDKLTSTVAVAYSTGREVFIEHLGHEGKTATLQMESNVLSVHNLPIKHQNYVAVVTANGINMYMYGHGKLTFLQTLLSVPISSGSIEVAQPGHCSGATLLVASYVTSDTMHKEVAIYSQKSATFTLVVDFKCTKLAGWNQFSDVTGDGLECWCGPSGGSSVETVLNLDKSVKLVLSSGSGLTSGSGVITLNTHLINITDPYRKEFQDIDAMYNNLSDLLDELNNILEDYSQYMAGTIEPKDFDNGDWKFIKNVETRNDVVAKDWKTGKGNTISGKEFEAMLDRAEREIQNILELLKEIQQYMDALGRDDEVLTLTPEMTKRIENIVTKELKLSEVAALLEDLVLKSSLNPIETEKSFGNIIVEDLYVDTVNKIRIPTDIITTTDEEAILGDLTYKDTLYANQITLRDGSTVNGIDLSQDAVYVGGPKTGSNVDFAESLLTSSMTGGGLLDGMTFGDRFLKRSGDQVINKPKYIHAKIMNSSEVKVHTINKKPVDHLNQVVLKNRDEEVSNKHMQTLLVNEDMQVELINGVAMAGEFASKSDLQITGMKYFNDVVCGSVLSDSVNGEATDNIVILSSHKLTINSKTHLNKGAEFNKLQVTGFIDGVYLDSSLLNHLENKSLEYHNDVIFSGDVNSETINLLSEESPLMQLINDLITQHMDVVELPGLIAGGMSANDSLQTDLINGIKPESLIKVDTYQKWTDTKMTLRYPEFKSLSAANLNGVDIGVLDKVIRVDRSQEIKHLAFNSFHMQDVAVQGWFIGDVNFTEVVQNSITQILPHPVLVDCDITSLGVDGTVHMLPYKTIAGLDVSAYAEHYLSLSANQKITAHYTIDHDDCSDKFSIYSVNSHPLDKLLSGILLKRKSSPQVLTGNIKGLDLVSNTVTAKFGLHNIPLAAWKNDILWLNRDQAINERLHFKQASLRQFGDTTVCGVDTKQLENHSLLKDGHKRAVIEGRKYLGLVSVNSDVNVRVVNDKPAQSIATKSTPQTITERWRFNEEVGFQSVDVTGEGNKFDKLFELFHLVMKYYSKDDDGDKVVFTKDHFRSVSAGSNVNGVNLAKFLEDVVNIFKLATLTADKLVTQVRSKSNVKTQMLNDEKLSELIKDLLLKNVDGKLIGDITLLQPVKTDVLHTQAVRLAGEFTVLEGNKFDDLIYLNTTQLLTDLDLTLRDSAAIAEDLVVNMINRIDMSNLVTLNTPQVLSGGEQGFAYIKSLDHVHLSGFLQGLNIKRWRDNTLNNTGDVQFVMGKKLFIGSVLSGNVIPGTVNGITDFQDQVVLLQEDQTLQGGYSFDNVEAERVIWPGSPLKGNILYTSQENLISGEYMWTTPTKFSSISGDVLVDTVNLPDIKLDSDTQRKDSVDKTGEFWEHGMCKESGLDSVKDSNMGYLVALGSLYLNYTVTASHTLQIGSEVYMIVSTGCADCRCTDLYHVSNEKLEHVTTLPVGGVISAWSSFTTDQLYLVSTKLDEDCSTHGTVIYSISGVGTTSFTLKVVQLVEVGGAEMEIDVDAKTVYLVVKTDDGMSLWTHDKSGMTSWTTFTNQPVHIKATGKFCLMRAFGHTYIIVEEEKYLTFYNMKGMSVGYFSITDQLTDIIQFSSVSGDDNFIALAAKSSDDAIKCTTYVKILLAAGSDVGLQGEEFTVRLYDEIYLDDVTSLAAAFTNHHMYLMLLQKHAKLNIYDFRGASGFVEVLTIPHPLAATVETSSGVSVYTTISSQQTLTLYKAHPKKKHQLHRSLCPGMKSVQKLVMPDLGNSRSRRSHDQIPLHSNASWNLLEGDGLFLNFPNAFSNSLDEEDLEDEVIDEFKEIYREYEGMYTTEIEIHTNSYKSSLLGYYDLENATEPVSVGSVKPEVTKIRSDSNVPFTLPEGSSKSTYVQLSVNVFILAALYSTIFVFFN